jgi:hypothetical protein
VDTLERDGPINAALLAKSEKKERSPLSISKEALQPIQPNAPPHVPPYPPLALVTKPNLTMADLGYYLDRRPQTCRSWASLENGPLRPKRIGGLLAWSTTQVKALAGVA